MKIGGVTITVLAENTAQGAGLLGEHGLSLWIETPESRVLFDTGQGLTLLHNAAALGIALEDAGAIVLSHGHYDHSGGLLQALDRAPGARLYLHPAALLPRFSRRGGRSHAIGMPAPVRDAVEARRSSIVWTREPAQVAPGVFATGPIPRRTGFEDTGGPFFLDGDGQVPDPIEDDQALWIETPDGLVALLGCAHSGAINTLDTIRALAGRKPLLAVLGGMHLGSASDERLAKTLEALAAGDIGALYPCHCTGAAATAALWTAFGKRCHSGGAGTRIQVRHER